MQNNTIKLAAKKAGVSVASVSRALNGKPGISEETRKKIIVICEELGYQPSDAARKLKIGTTKHIGFCLGKTDREYTHYISLVYDSLHQILGEQGLVLEIFKYQEIDKAIKGCSGLILTGIEHNDDRVRKLKKIGMPFVTIGQSEDNFWVCPDDLSGGKLAAEYLYSIGCRKPLVVECLSDAKVSLPRSVGFKQFMQNEGIVSGQLAVTFQSAIELQAYRAFQKVLINTQFDYDCIFCENDDIAYGICLACEDAGIEIPQDVKIMGFDDLPNFETHITTIKQDIFKISNTAVELLKEAKALKPPRGVMLDVEIVKKQTA